MSCRLSVPISSNVAVAVRERVCHEEGSMYTHSHTNTMPHVNITKSTLSHLVYTVCASIAVQRDHT